MSVSKEEAIKNSVFGSVSPDLQVSNNDTSAAARMSLKFSIEMKWGYSCTALATLVWQTQLFDCDV